MDAVPRIAWTTREVSELIAFFGWMDALCVEARRRGLAPPWPLSDHMSESLNYWIVDFGGGLTPAEALDIHQSISRRGEDSSGRGLLSLRAVSRG
jgi:hypothetical protein